MNRNLTQGSRRPTQTASLFVAPRERMLASSYGRIHHVTRTLTLALIVLLCAAVAAAQVTTGNVRGVVKDQNGAVVAGAQVTLTNKATNIAQSTQTTNEGVYEFNNLLAGEYALTIEAPNFKALTVGDVRVLLNQTTDVPAELQVGLQGETVDVSAGGAELVDTTTTNLSKGFNERQVVELAQSAVPANTSLGVYNLGLVAPNVASSGGVGVGSGGAVGGQRPRNNNFVVDGVDNNDKVNTGPKIYVSPETVSEFSLLANQYSAEFGHSTGGQFILATKSGTNQFHGTAYGFFNNRYLNAIDVANKQPGSSFTREQSRVDPGNGVSFIPRADFDRYGGNVGGPIIKNRLFFFTSYEGYQQGNAAGTQFLAPTAEGLAGLSTIPGLSQSNLNLFKQFVPVASSFSRNIQVSCVQGSAGCTNRAGAGEAANFQRDIAVGGVSIASPFFFNRRNFVLNMDYTQSSRTQHRGRYIVDSVRQIDNLAVLPTFYTNLPNKQHLFSYTLLHTLTSKLTNETRLAYRRSTQFFVVPNITFPLTGFDAFPNIGIGELGLDIGPDPNAPQFTIENNYQIVNNLTWLLGAHSVKFGGDFRKLISPQRFVQRERGDYQYNALDTFLRDSSPEALAERNVGGNTYYGDQRLFFAFAQDDWRYRPNLTLNLGLNYAYQEIPFGAKQQELNAISSVPGLIEFRRPKAQKWNFAPRVGIAYSPAYSEGLLGRLFGGSGKTSIRAGFSMAYDVIFDNIYTLSSPPQFQQTIDVAEGVPNFLASGGIRNTIGATGNDAAAARAATSAFIDDQQVPYSITYTGSIQRQFHKDYSLELRYLGTRGVHLLTQNRINVRSIVNDAPGGFLPTFLARPSQSKLNSLTTTLDDLANQSNFVPAFERAGFNGNNVVGFLSNGNSSYHAFSAQLQRRFARGLQGTAAYTWSHLIDDTTAEVFSTLLSPRRVQDFQNLRSERADSALDRRHRFVMSGLYDLPFFTKDENRLVRTLLGGFRFAGTLTFESGEKATVRSGIDSNLNGDAAGDRAIINLNGVRNTASTVSELTNSAGQVVAYLADNPNAQYIQAGAGARANGGRNTLQLPGINNLDFSLFKDFALSENRKVQFRVDLFNAFNHPQFVPGSVNGGEAIATTSNLINTLNNIDLSGVGNFNRPDAVFSSHPRIIQLALRFNF